MRRIIISSLLFLTITLLISNPIEAKWECDINAIPAVAGPPVVPAQPRCVENAFATNFNSLRECLRGANNPIDEVTTDANKCKQDPRYIMRNFAALNFWSIGKVLSLAIPLATAGAGLLAGAFLLYGGFMYVSAGGDSKKIQDAMRTILYACVGLLIVVVAYMLVRTLLIITKTNTFGF